MRKKTIDEFKREVKEIHGDDVIVLGDYKSNKDKILIRYVSCGHEEYKMPIKILTGQGCGKCRGISISKAKTKSLEKYKADLISNGIKHIEVIGEYKGIKNKVKVKNLICGHEYESNAGNVLRGSGCPICHGMKDTATFTEQIENKYPGEYLIIGEYVNNRKPIRVKHKCGYEWDVIPKDLMRDIRCPKCIISKGELFISNYLNRKAIDYRPQYSFRDCRDKNPLPFDFMIKVNGRMMLIEFDGVQHFAKGKYYNPKVITHDTMKNKYCEEHNIPLLRIPYWWIRNDRAERKLDKFIFDK